MNARFDDEAGVVDRHRAVHLGIAVQTRRGLMVPVVKDADRRDIWSCAAEVARLSESARAGTVTLEELSGSTITITSLGALGGVVTTPVINAPEVAIIGVNKIMTRPVYVDGTLGRAPVHEPLVVVRPSCGRWPRRRRVHPGHQAAARDAGPAVHALSAIGGRFLQDGASSAPQDGGMNLDLTAATAFMATHARLLDRRRFELPVRASRADGGARRVGRVPQPRRGIWLGTRARSPLAGEPAGWRAACPRGVRRGRTRRARPVRSPSATGSAQRHSMMAACRSRCR